MSQTQPKVKVEATPKPNSGHLEPSEPKSKVKSEAKPHNTSPLVPAEASAATEAGETDTITTSAAPKNKKKKKLEEIEESEEISEKDAKLLKDLKSVLLKAIGVEDDGKGTVMKAKTNQFKWQHVLRISKPEEKKKSSKLKRPRKPRTGFNFFQCRVREIGEIAKDPDFNWDLALKKKKTDFNDKLARLTGKLWRDLDSVSKTFFTDVADLDKVRYTDEKERYDRRTQTFDMPQMRYYRASSEHERYQFYNPQSYHMPHSRQHPGYMQQRPLTSDFEPARGSGPRSFRRVNPAHLMPKHHPNMPTHRQQPLSQSYTQPNPNDRFNNTQSRLKHNQPLDVSRRRSTVSGTHVANTNAPCTSSSRSIMQRDVGSSPRARAGVMSDSDFRSRVNMLRNFARQATSGISTGSGVHASGSGSGSGAVCGGGVSVNTGMSMGGRMRDVDPDSSSRRYHSERFKHMQNQNQYQQHWNVSESPRIEEYVQQQQRQRQRQLRLQRQLQQPQHGPLGRSAFGAEGQHVVGMNPNPNPIHNAATSSSAHEPEPEPVSHGGVYRGGQVQADFDCGVDQEHERATHRNRNQQAQAAMLDGGGGLAYHQSPSSIGKAATMGAQITVEASIGGASSEALDRATVL
eukprot:CAMPEP_0197543364 /NCGR_PEP_ID=MMETSP1318-20131121/68199_1 /TAXON_ID=552666 /ORGANISM="Partenskyella glossopodia, Strain RCC365" /LENGTH=629 /DNA_ID=CAMNT_0043102693 /DNA_START=170 /DNA_END=2061 /DNA_ORIENTATION=-